MKLKLLTLALDPETGAFPDDPLASVPGEVVSVAEHFFSYGGLPRLLLIVHHEPERRRPAERGAPEPRRAEPEDGLAAHERPIYAVLAKWRKARAEADGLPPFAILTNKELIEVVRRRPAGVDAQSSTQKVVANRGRRLVSDAVLAGSWPSGEWCPAGAKRRRWPGSTRTGTSPPAGTRVRLHGPCNSADPTPLPSLRAAHGEQNLPGGGLGSGVVAGLLRTCR